VFPVTQLKTTGSGVEAQWDRKANDAKKSLDSMNNTRAADNYWLR
jgi:hypothetical protein